MSDPVSFLSSRVAKLNPFSNHDDDDEEFGDEIEYATLAGGGHSARRTDIIRNQLRVSHALKSFLVHQKVLSEKEAALGSDHKTEALQSLLSRPHIAVPSYLADRSHPLTEYFISSSHNTYLLAHQLVGKSSATAYETALKTGSRCIEIDAWDNSDSPEEPKVTHGYTLVSHIPFRAVCETIRDVVDQEAADAADEQGYRAAPILVSLENHCDPNGQLRLVQIMKEVWGDRLLSKEVREEGRRQQEGSGEEVYLEELGSKICVIVEYHFPQEPTNDDDDDDDDDDEENEEEREARKVYKAKKKAASTVIIPELAELGVYAQSVKPVDNSWFEAPEMINGPHHHLINVSETGLASHMPANNEKIARHNAKHLMRVFPKGTRISSRNLKPVPFWAVGAQICALNWQTFGASLQLNEALFSGTEGYVLKPAALRAGGDGKLSTGKKMRLRLHVGGASELPLPADRGVNDVKPYLTCTLVHPDSKPEKQKTSPYKHHKLGFLHRGENPAANDPIWDETLEWEYDDNELVFLRMMIKSDDSFAANPILAVTAVRLQYTISNWVFIRMLDLKGQETKCSLLVKFQIDQL